MVSHSKKIITERERTEHFANSSYLRADGMRICSIKVSHAVERCLGSELCNYSLVPAKVGVDLPQ